MKYLVVVADDFGFTQGINKACVEAVQKGILTEMSLMMDAPASKEAIRIARQNNIPDLGIHITLHDIVGTGTYLRTSDYKKLLSESLPDKLIARVKDELQRFEQQVGRPPTHINGHKNCHLHPKIITTVSEYAAQHGIYVRRPHTLSDGNNAGADMTSELVKRSIKLTDFIFEHINASYDNAYADFLEDLENVPDKSVTEIFFHPGYVDEELSKSTSLVEGRTVDLQLLLDGGFENKIRSLGFSLTTFTHIPS